MGKKSPNRTSSAESQWQYDNFLADLDISSLRFLEHKYGKDLSDFRNNNDLNDQENAQLYKEMQQRKLMIGEELFNREQISLTPDKDIFFTDDYDVIIIDESGHTKRYKPLLYEESGNIETESNESE